VACQLRDPGAVPVLAICVDRLHPGGTWELEDRLANRLGQLIADREADARLPAITRKRMRRAADVRADQDLPLTVLGGKLL